MTKLNYLDIEEMAGWIKDRLDDREATHPLTSRAEGEIDAECASRHIMRSLEAEGLALLPATNQWPPTATFHLGDEVKYSTCGSSGCHSIRATIAGWFLQPTAANPERFGYVIRYGYTHMPVSAEKLRPFQGDKS